MLEGLESLTVPCVTCYSYMLEAIGKNCRNFSELKVLCPLDIEFAESLIKHIPKLKILSLRCSLVYTEALRCILKGLEYLEVLNLSHSMFFAELDHEGAETSNILIQRGGEIPAAMDVSRLERLVACQGETSCFLCQLMLENPSVGGRGYRFQEAMWREDEISSLAH
ncbi:F-box/LRR-repeat protein [Quillaja saponaria]|uniref:F-box/LRR-repeat protein n=1 Tax=Quillaja saponaria TaxID=32244 RepID=A0AAD7KSC2_QUISA|nr:F-box/LRR-repeat protein [Quillaja saponaria]